MMGKNGAKETQENFIKISNWEIKRAKEGLDESQVTNIINELVSQRDELAQRTEHLTTLTKLAERTVAEADKLAAEMKVQAIEETKTEAANIMRQAEAKAREMENETRQLQVELKGSAEVLLNQLLNGLDGLKQQVVTLKTESEQKLSTLAENDRPAALESEASPPANSPPAAPPVATQPIAEAATETPMQSPDTAKEKPSLEIEILPPLDIMKIMEIVTYLDNLPEVENTELIPNTERPSIIVNLRESINLIEMLKTLPVIAEIKADTAEVAEGDRPKAFASLTAEPALQKAGKEQS